MLSLKYHLLSFTNYQIYCKLSENIQSDKFGKRKKENLENLYNLEH